MAFRAVTVGAILFLGTNIASAEPAQCVGSPQTSADLAAAGMELVGSTVIPDEVPLLVTFWRDDETAEMAGEILSKRTFRCVDSVKVQISDNFCQIAYRND